ncbi:Hsp20/alpha crystallin family protein [Desulforhopalus sp. 52FAK]
MNLVRYNPQCRTAVTNRPSADIFDGFFNPLSFANNVLNNRETHSLKVDIFEKDENIIIEAELAGVQKEDITVDIKGKILTLGAERKHNEEVAEENRYRKERSYGTFERKFSLPFEAEAENISANFNNGVLTLTITKPETQVAKKITIN